MFNLVIFLLYFVLGSILHFAGVFADTWQFWALLSTVLAIDVVSFFKGMKS